MIGLRRFASGEDTGAVEANVNSPTARRFGPIGPQSPLTTITLP